MFCLLPLLSNFTQSRQSSSDCGGVTAGRTLGLTEGLEGNQPSTHTVRVSINPKGAGGLSSMGSLSLLISIFTSLQDGVGLRRTREGQAGTACAMGTSLGPTSKW